MDNKKKGLLFCLLGGGLLLSIFLDFIRRRPLVFGPAQISLFFVSIAIICLGLLILCIPDIKVSQIFAALKKILPYNVFFNIIILAAIMLLLIYPLQYIINLLSFPYPLEYRDAASVYSAIAFSKGINPYNLQNFPQYIFLYGLMYPLLQAPFISLVDHPLLVARGIEVLFLVLFLGMSFWIFRKRNASIISSLIGVLILLNSICYIWKINGARPDASGLFFAFLGFCFLLKGEPDTIRILLCALSCVISFYFKQYMIFSTLVVSVYLILFVSKQKGFLFIAATITLGLVSFLTIRCFFPLYYEYSIMRGALSVGTTAYMVKQSKDFLGYYWILCFLYLFYLHKTFSVFGFRRLIEIRLMPFNLKAPFIRGGSVDLFNVGIIVSVLILTFSLGRNDGNIYTYYGELLLPFLLYLIIPKINELFKINLHQNLIQVLILAFCVFPFRVNYSTDFTSYQNAFSVLSQYADRCTNIYDETPLIALYKIEHKMYPVYNNGQIEYAQSVIPDRENIFGKLSVLPAELFDQQLLEWNNDIESSIKNQKFDCIFTENEQEIKNYKLVERIENVLGRTIYVQVPREP
jgi:hypothetical protein